MENAVRETAMTPVGYTFMLTAWTVILALAIYCFKRILTEDD
jgi:hypothetical protein